MHRAVERLGALTFVLAVLLLYSVPIAFWLLSADFTGSDAARAGVLYASLLSDTVAISIGASLIALLLGGSTALLYAFSGRRMRSLLRFCMTLPLIIGFLARNYAWLGFLSYLSGRASTLPGGMLLGNFLLYEQSGVVLVMATVFIPFVFFIVLEGVGAVKREHFEAARTLGASDTRSFLAITLAIPARSYVSGFFIAAVLSLGYFVTPAMIGGGKQDFIGNGVITLLHTLGDSGAASVLALYLLLTALIPVLGATLFSSRRRRLLTEGA